MRFRILNVFYISIIIMMSTLISDAPAAVGPYPTLQVIVTVQPIPAAGSPGPGPKMPVPGPNSPTLQTLNPVISPVYFQIVGVGLVR